MSKFQFRLQTLLKFRCNRRDQCRQVLAEVLARDAELSAEKSRVIGLRNDQLRELRRLNACEELDIDASASRRFFAGQLHVMLSQIDRQRELVASQIKLCRQTLVQADRDVKVLENLSEKQEAEYLYAQERAVQRELEDSWSAGHQHEAPIC